MQSQLLYLSVVEQNLERYEAKQLEAGTVSEKLREYIKKKKEEITRQKNALLDLTEKVQSKLF